MTGSLRLPRKAALAALAVLVGAASLVSFAESYRGLFIWAGHHGLAGAWAVVWPLQVDVFIAVGELALFVALADSWAPHSRAAAWIVTLAGLAVSVAGNVGHVASHELASRATAAVPPLAAAAALAVGLGVLKRTVAQPVSKKEGAPAHVPPSPAPRTAPRPARKASSRGTDAAQRTAIEAISQGQPMPSARALARAHHIGRDKAGEIRATALASSNGHAPPDPASDARQPGAGQEA